MCTVTWRFTPEAAGWALDLGFNRDERRSRPRARPPREQRPANGLPFIAPVDPAGGGTWLALNAAGLCLGLLNLYEEQEGSPTPAVTLSRGQLVWRLAGLADAESVRDGLRRCLEHERLQPFQLFLAQGGATRQAILWRWDGHALTDRDLTAASPILSSSSYQTDAVVAGRLALHDAAGLADLDPQERLPFHRSHRPVRGPWSVCMHRLDARTVSYSQLRASETELSFRYAQGAPCRAALGPALILARSE